MGQMEFGVWFVQEESELTHGGEALKRLPLAPAPISVAEGTCIRQKVQTLFAANLRDIRIRQS